MFLGRVGTTVQGIVLATLLQQAAAADLQVGDFVFDPPFVEASGPQKVEVKVELIGLQAASVALEQQSGFHRGRAVFRRIATLRNEFAEIYSGTATFQPYCGVATLRVRTHKGLTSDQFGLPSASAYFPTAPVLDDRVFVLGEASKFKIKFSVPRAGEVILSANNGAQDTVAPLHSAEIRLNGHVVASGHNLRHRVDCVEQRVHLKRGENLLVVKAHGRRGDRLSVRIDAPADKLALKTPPNPVDLREPALEAEAEITALGLPVEGAAVLFEVNNLDNVVEATAQTNDLGSATKEFFEFKTPGIGVLTGRVPRSEFSLGDEVYFQIVEKPTVALGLPADSVTVREGEQEDYDIVISVQQNGAWTLGFEQTIDPPSGGLESDVLFPVGFEEGQRLQGFGPTDLVLRHILRGNTLGAYQIRTRVTNEETLAISEGLQTVDVVPRDADAPAHVFVPTSFPAAIPPNTPTEVLFRVAFAGPKNRPEQLILEQEGVGTVGNLTDIDGDYVYEGQIIVESEEAVLFYQAQTPAGFSQEVTSGVYAFDVTPLASEIGVPSDEEDDEFLISANGNEFLAEQAILTPSPGVPSSRVRDIVEAVGAEIVGFLPAVDKYIVKKKGADTVGAVDELIDALRSFDEVAIAGRNSRLFLAQAAPPEFPNDPSFENQENLQRVRAQEAWLVSGTVVAAEVKHIAVLDTGVSNHNDLANQIDVFGPDCVEKGDPESTIKFGDPNGHGTRVTGVAAAEVNNATSIAGMGGPARDTGEDEGGDGRIQFVPVFVKGPLSGADNLHCGIEYLLSNPHGGSSLARIANLSTYVSPNTADLTDERIQSLIDTDDENLLDTVNRALDAGILIVAAAGNGPSSRDPDDSFVQPAGYNVKKGGPKNPNGLIVVGNTDDEDERYDDEPNPTLYGSWVDLAAPGVDVVTTKGNNDATTVGDQDRRTGTSFSSPLVAAAAAFYWSGDGSRHIKDVERRLKDSVEGLPKSSKLGKGRLDAAAAVANLRMEMAGASVGGDTLANWSRNRPSRCRLQNKKSDDTSVDFYRAREGKKFLVCGDDGEALVQGQFDFPNEIETFILRFRIAGMRRTSNGELRCIEEARWSESRSEQSRVFINPREETVPYTITFRAASLIGEDEFQVDPSGMRLSVTVETNEIAQSTWQKDFELGPCPGSTTGNRIRGSEANTYLLLDDLQFRSINKLPIIQ